MSNVPKEAIEAAAKAFYNDPQGLTDWDLLASVEPDLADRYRSSMSRALEAAMPFLNQPRVITTKAELEALPIGSVLRGRHRDFWEREQHDGQPVLWLDGEYAGWYPLNEAVDHGVPFTVLYEERDSL